MIEFNEGLRVFHLRSAAASYVIGISPTLDLRHLYWGQAVDNEDLPALVDEWTRTEKPASCSAGCELFRREYADFGHDDQRSPAIQLAQADGSRISHFVYRSHVLLAGKPTGGGPPATYVETADEAQTLQIALLDELKGHKLRLCYTLYESRDIIVRSALLANRGDADACVLKLMSASVDLPPGSYRGISFVGAWARERQPQERPLGPGTMRFESRRGQSSHEINPSLLVTRGPAAENHGEVYGFMPVYSGNWLIEAEAHRTRWLRVNAGLNDFDFQWRLGPGESFCTPECVLVYSSEGLSGLSHRLHRFVRQRVARGRWRDRVRPVLMNSWEATYLRFSYDDIMRIAQAAAEIGAELFVLDDGWFGERDSDDRSLGDWVENRSKLPEGIRGLSDRIHELSMRFGLWFEPEMVSPRSELYRRHPDWCLHVPGRERNVHRSQLVLDVSRPEVRDYLFESIGRVLEQGAVDYVKWDMNRSHTEVGSAALPPQRQAEVSHRFMLGLYELMERLTCCFPDILFEGCAGGGGRFDLGILSYHPQIWTSDNTDGLDRLFIQYGTSFCYPPVTHGAHVSDVPCHQTGRVTPLRWRAHVAMSGNFGFEADISRWSEADRRQAAEFVRTYRQLAPLVQFGDFYRLESPYGAERAAWMFVNEEQTEAALFIFQIRARPPGAEPEPVILRGLDPQRHYEILEERVTVSGRRLMAQGLLPRDRRAGEYHSELYRLKAR
jgi:alpha-galactosidase